MVLLCLRIFGYLLDVFNGKIAQYLDGNEIIFIIDQHKQFIDQAAFFSRIECYHGFVAFYTHQLLIRFIII